MSEKKKKLPSVPEWYKRAEVDAKARDEFFEEVTTLQSRQIMVDIPAKMMLELGRIALTERIPFHKFINKILDEFLKSRGVDWRTAPDRTEEWLRLGPGATEENREYVRKLGVKFER